MTQKKPRTEVKDLPKKGKKLNEKEMKKVKGGKGGSTMDFEKFGSKNNLEIGRQSANAKS